tara:strand:- start:97 stop:300 length:204 start_codon:yes stop_codon:yes gene_type:complete
VEIGNGISIIAKVMNYLVLIKEKIKRAKRLSEAQLLATKNGEFVNYKPSVFEKRKQNAKEDLENKNL